MAQKLPRKWDFVKIVERLFLMKKMYKLWGNDFSKNEVLPWVWYELYNDDEVSDYWAIIDCIEDGDVYLAERSTLNNVFISIINKKTGEEIGSCPVWIETDETGDEVYQKLKDNDFYLKFLGIPIADSIEKLNAMEWKQDFYDYLQNNPSEFLNDLSNEDIDVGDLTIDDLEFKVK